MTCWNWKPDKRPGFEEIVDLLASDLPDTFRKVSYHLGKADKDVLVVCDESPADFSTAPAAQKPEAATKPNEIIKVPSTLKGVVANGNSARGEPDGDGSRAKYGHVEYAGCAVGMLPPSQECSGSRDGSGNSMLSCGSEMPLLKSRSNGSAGGTKKTSNRAQHYNNK